MADLDELLNTLRRGAQLDSAGKFTLNFLKAAAPFQLFLKEYPAWPWLRLVQVAHQQGAQAIDFQEQPQATSLGLLHRLIIPLGSVGTGQICLVRDGVVSAPWSVSWAIPA